MNGLNALDTVGGALVISRNPALQQVDGLIGLSTINGYLRIVDNDQLVSVNGLDNLSSLQGFLTYKNNAQSYNFDGFNSVETPITRLRISDNGVASINGFNSIPEVNSSVRITNNQNVVKVDGFNNITQIGGGLIYIDNATQIDTIDALHNLTQVQGSIIFSLKNSRFNLPNLESSGRLKVTGSAKNISVPNLNTLNGNLEIESFSLANSDSLFFPSLTSIQGNLWLSNVSSTSLNLPVLEQVEELYIYNSPILTFSAPSVTETSNFYILSFGVANLDLSSLATVNGSFRVYNCDNLLNLDGLPSLTSITSYIQLSYNNVLSGCAAYAVCAKLTTVPSSVYISWNADGCNNQAQINQACINNFEAITGNVFFDFDCNGIKEGLDIFAIAKSIEKTPQGNIGFTNALGNYQAFGTVGNEIAFHPQAINGYQSYPNNISLNIVDGNTYPNNNFRYCPTSTINDANVTLTPLMPVRPGFTQQYDLCYYNNGTQAEDLTVTFTIPQTGAGAYSTILTNVEGGVITGDSIITWSIADAAPMQGDCFTIYVQMATNTPLGSLFSSAANVYLGNDLADATPSNNTASLNQTVVGSYDPNDKTPTPKDLVFEFLDTMRVEYLIRFQNTGTYMATFIEVHDTLSENFDYGSLEMIAASHEYTLTTKPNGSVKWRFDDINLPDSTSDEPGSHGYIRFSIKTTGVEGLNSTISNTAAIYFDYNEPIITNTAVSEMLSALPITESFSKTGVEDQPILFGGINDFPAIDQAFPFTGIQFVTSPTNGQLKLNDVVLVTNQIVAAQDINSLQFVPAPNGSGNYYALVAFRAINQYDTSNLNTLFFILGAVNDQPTTQNKAIEINKNQVYTFGANDFPFDDPEIASVFQINIQSDPTAGVLKAGGIALPTPFSVASNELSSLNFTPATDAFGSPYTNFQFSVTDAEGLESAPATMTINVLNTNGTNQPSGWSLKVAPNPVQDKVSFSGNMPGYASSVELYDESGRLIETYDFESGKLTQSNISLKQLPSGNYQLKVLCNNQFHVFRIVKI